MNVFLAITCNDHKIYGECSEAILKNCTVLLKNGHTVTPFFHNDLYIDRSRNLCVDTFLSTQCTELVFVDSDLSFDDDAILKLMSYDKQLIGGAYPYKKDIEEYPIVLDFSKDNNCKEEETGLVRVKNFPTGLMRINRSVFEKIAPITPKDERGTYQFFQTGIKFKDDARWFGEDSFFCKTCRNHGIEMFVYPHINFKHYGFKAYAGNYHEYLMSRALDRMDKLDSSCAGINGWMSSVELSFLGVIASQCNSIVEIGSWKGRSTKMLLDNCTGTVHSVDTWGGASQDITSIVMELTNVYDEFIKNVGHYKNLIIHRGASVDMAKEIDCADMVFIDAGHTYKECKADIEAWLPKASKFICGHDYTLAFPGVIASVDEKFKKVSKIDSIWFVDIRKELK